MDGVIRNLRKLDVYPKIDWDFCSRTISGGIITLVPAILMFILFISELRPYLNAVTETKLIVDTSRGETLHINFDITFPALACSIVSLDVVDISGDQHLDVMARPLQRHGGRLEHNETYCGSCYGAEGSDEDCCNSCEEVREAYRKKGWGLSNPDSLDQCKREGFLQRIKDEEGEGCNIYGFLGVSKISHKINKLAFGDYFPGVVNPLDGVKWMQKTWHGMYQYFIKVVPTVYTDISGHSIQSNQFSVTENFRGAEVLLSQSIPVGFHRATCVILTLLDKCLCYCWRYFQNFWNIGFIHLPWSEGNE